MKILKIFGIVVGIHIFALVLIFANPGCSSTTKQPAPSATVAKAEPAAPLNVPSITPAPAAAAMTPASSDASSAPVRYMPTRPNSAAANTLNTEPVKDVMPATTYTVVNGDNLSKIAKKTHLTIAELAAANDLKPNAPLHPGQKLKVPSKSTASSAPGAMAPMAATDAAAPAAAKAEPAPARAPGEVLKHTVKSGETLGAIAKKYEVRVADIAVANNISDPAKIKPGQELIIPGWDSKSGTKTGKNGKSSSTAKAGDTKAPAVEQPAAAPVPAAAPPITPIAPADDSPIKPAPRP